MSTIAINTPDKTLNVFFTFSQDQAVVCAQVRADIEQVLEGTLPYLTVNAPGNTYIIPSVVLKQCVITLSE